LLDGYMNAGFRARGERADVLTRCPRRLFTMSHARRARAFLAALAIGTLILGAIPLASRAAPAKPIAVRPAPVKTVARKAQRVTAYRPHGGLAPADEYFGRLQMSVLGVRNKVKDLGLDADVHPEHGRAILGNAVWVEDAMRDWARKYPFDRWLPRYAYALEEMYEQLPGSDAHRRAVKQVAYLTAYFPQTLYGKIGRAKLAMGVPARDASERPALTDLERLALIDGKVSPTLPPVPAPRPTPIPTPSASPAVPDASASPAAAPTPIPATTARP
jgi:hypothetical protein